MNNNDLQENQDSIDLLPETEEVEEQRSPFLLIYALIIFLAVLVAVGLWIVKSFHDVDKVESPNKEQTVSVSVSKEVTSVSSSSDSASASSSSKKIENKKDDNKEAVEDPKPSQEKPYFTNSEEELKLTKLDKERLLSEQYEGVFLKMHNLNTFTENDFKLFRGLRIICTEGMVYNTSELQEALSLIFANSRTIPEMYFEIDPYDLWINAGDSDKKRDGEFNKILTYIDTHPETIFEFAYSVPSVKFWNELSEEEFSQRQEVYYHVTNLLKARSNVYVYALGNQEWLIANPTNYTYEFIPNQKTWEKLALLMFCDRQYQFTLEDVMNWFIIVKNISDCDKLGMYSCTLPAGEKVVFLADSVFDFYRDSYGASNVASYITGAKTYNLGKGGLTLASDETSPFSFAYLNAGVCSRKLPKLYKETDFAVEFKTFLNETDVNDKLTFVVMLGINDFLNGAVSYKKGDKTSNNTTYSALLTQVKKLKKAYPNSEVVIVVPYQLDSDPDQPARTAEFGTGEKQANYSEAIEKVATKLGCDCLNLFAEGYFNEGNFNEMLKSDCIHPSEQGEFEIAKAISKFLLTRKK